MTIDPTEYRIYSGPTIDDEIVSGRIQIDQITDQEIASYAQSNNIPADAVIIRTSVGGVVWVNPNSIEIIQAYQTGALTGGFGEVAGAGVFLRVLPRIISPPSPIIDGEISTTTIAPLPVVTPLPSTTPISIQRNKISFTVPIIVNILQKKEISNASVSIQITISPAPLKSQVLLFGKQRSGLTSTISTFPINVNVSIPVINSAFVFLDEIYETYVDEDRELKTLLNYGEDRQTVVVSYRRGPVDINDLQTIQLKLLDPVPTEISTNSTVFLSREVAKSIIDKVRIKFAPEIDASPYLRPKNLSIKSNLDTGKSLNNVTLNVLSLNSGSVGTNDLYKNISFEDKVFRQWYSYDFNSAELNIDFSNYNNFVFYGSAAMRLATFREKLRQLEKIEANRIQFLSSSTFVGNPASSGFIFVQQKSAEYAKEKEDIIRGFDRYEQYLYFTPSGSNSPYSASAYYVDNGIEYNQFGYWPKNSSGSLYSVYEPQSIAWYTVQSEIAQRFDEFNENNLINTIPTYLREDEDSSSYMTFVSMIGHFFDLIKPYVDQMPNIWNRNLNPNEYLSKDLMHEIAESFGFTLPSIDSTYNITDYILGSNNEIPRRDLTVEIYKRILHNLTFFSKAKGSKTGLESYLRTFGITPQLVNIKESGVPVTGSYYTYDEYSTALDFDDVKTSYIAIPIASSLRSPTTIQFSCVVGKAKNMTILNGDNRWALNVTPHPSNYNIGRFEITSGSSQTLLLSSSYQEIYNEIPVNIVIDVAGSTSTLRVIQVEKEDIVFNSIMSETSSFSGLWNATQFAYIGGTGPLVVNRFEGYVDEVRLWKDNISSATILNTAFDPGSSAGDTYDAASEHLLVQLSFNNLNSALLNASSSINNESPYKNITVAPSLQNIFAFNISGSDFSRYNRTIRQEMLQGGSSAYTTSKINIASPPSFVNTKNGLRLYKNKSIVIPESKKYTKGYNKIILSASPTDIVNQNIIRVFGTQNINSLLGAPSNLYTSFNLTLNLLKKHYQQYYNVTVNKNRFVRILSELSEILNQSVGYFIPARATLTKGITIEPNVLEQVKITPVKNIRFYGKNTRKTLAAAGSKTGSSPDYSATFNLSKNIDAIESSTVIGSLKNYKVELSKLSQEPNIFVSGKISPKSSSIDIYPLDIDGAFKKLNSNLQINPIIPVETVNKLSTELDGVINTISGSVSNLKSTLSKFPTNISSSFVTYVADAGVSVQKITGSYNSHTTTINVENDWSLNSQNKTFNIKHISTNLKNINKELSGSRLPSSYNLGLANMNKIPYNSVNYGSAGAEPYNRVYSRKLFSSEITSTRNGGSASLYIPALYDIPPSADFRDYGVYTYFSNTTGVYYFPEILKSPSYVNPLNQTWNNSNQQFDSINVWSHGSKYNVNDVVYQDIDNTYISDLGLDVVKASNSGNKLYYVFKTKPSYKPSFDGTAFYSGSVPSYTPPSLDKKNWEVLRFTPTRRLIPKRVVFDIYTNSNLSQTNFKTTTIPININVDNPTRYVDTISVTSIQSNSYTIGEFLLQNISALFAIQSNFAGLRIRLYRTAAARDRDLSRPSSVRPTGSHGVLLDMQIQSKDTSIFTNPIPTLIADGIPPAGTLYYTIDNLESSDKISVTILLYYFSIEIEPKIPRGYLRKHYRFFRDNSTATKRRNYRGCKNTENTTIDGLPPVQILLSEGSGIVVSQTQTNEEIITGGGGQLNVT